MHPLITFDRVSFEYQQAEGPAIPALRDVSLAITEGEFVALVGANGSGKSTFARLASGLLQPTSGIVRVGGLDTRRKEARAAIHAEVGMVFQFPEDQIVSTTVEEDAAFGPENLGLPPAEIRARVEAALREVRLWDERRQPPHQLSAGQTQRLALAGVLAMRPRCILFDEASTMLDPAGRRALMQAMRRLNAEGTTILFITHFMEEAVEAGRVIVFARGQVALDGAPGEVFSDAPRLESLGLDLPPAAQAAARLQDALPPGSLPAGLLTLPALLEALPPFPGRVAGVPPAAFPESESPVTPEVIRVEGLGYTYMRGTPLARRALDGVDLRVRDDQVHALLGMTGSGKSTLIQHLNALLRPQEGRVWVDGFDMNDPRTDRRQVIRKVGLVFQNPEAQFFAHFVGDEIAYGPRQLQVEEPLAARVRWAMEQVGLDFERYKDRPLFQLSGGERRKVALASTLALRPQILLLDEPTAGLDPRSRQELLARLLEMRAGGMTLLLSTHQMEDVAALARTLTVFEKGRVVVDGSATAIFADQERLRDYGLEAPVAIQVAQALRARGWPVVERELSIERLAAGVTRALREVGGCARSGAGAGADAGVGV